MRANTQKQAPNGSQDRSMEASHHVKTAQNLEAMQFVTAAAESLQSAKSSIATTTILNTCATSAATRGLIHYGRRGFNMWFSIERYDTKLGESASHPFFFHLCSCFPQPPP